MKKKLQVIGYQPDTLCTRADLEKFDMIWWARKPVAEITYDYTPRKFNLSEVAAYVFGTAIHEVNALRKL